MKNQWIDNFVECGINKSDIATHIYDAPNKTFCVVTISSIENELRKDWHGLLKVMDEANFGIRVTDEAHLHLKGNLYKLARKELINLSLVNALLQIDQICHRR